MSKVQREYEYKLNKKSHWFLWMRLLIASLIVFAVTALVANDLGDAAFLFGAVVLINAGWHFAVFLAGLPFRAQIKEHAKACIDFDIHTRNQNIENLEAHIKEQDEWLSELRQETANAWHSANERADAAERTRDEWEKMYFALCEKYDAEVQELQK